MARYYILSFFLLHAKITFMCTQKTNSMAIACRVVKLKNAIYRRKIR